MFRHATRFLVLLLVMCPVVVSAEKIKVDYDQGVDFAKFKTYSWAELPPAGAPLLRLNIIGAIDEQLAAKGMQKVEKGGDVVVAYSGGISSEENQPVSAPAYPGYAGPPPAVDATMWTGQAGAGGAGASSTFTKGSLVVELMDPGASKIAWRAVGVVNFDATKKQESMEKLNRMIANMFERYPPAKK